MENIMFWVHFQLQALRDREEGATAVEYGLMVGLIAVAIIITVTALGTKLNNLFSQVSSALPTISN